MKNPQKASPKVLARSLALSISILALFNAPSLQAQTEILPGTPASPPVSSSAAADAQAQERMATEFEDPDDVEENPMQNPASATIEVPPDSTAQDENFIQATPTTQPPQARGKVAGDVIKENRYPEIEERFVKPPAPKGGGSVRVPHPDAGKGLLRIDKDGSYQYKVKLKEKSSSAGFRIAMMSPPVIDSGTAGISYSSMYGDTSLTGAAFDYEWQPFRKFGSLGFNLSAGFATSEASGFLASSLNRSEEVYSLYILPLAANLVYRFEYSKRQKLVPYVIGGVSYFAMYERRDDNKRPKYAGAPAAGGGAGLLISLSKWDQKSAFTLSEEYGVADMWLSVEARVLKGLKADIDFTGQTIFAGVTVDY